MSDREHDEWLRDETDRKAAAHERMAPLHKRRPHAKDIAENDGRTPIDAGLPEPEENDNVDEEN